MHCAHAQYINDYSVQLQILFFKELTVNTVSGKCFKKSTCLKPDGGARRDRTDDLMLAKHALSQLSYGPVICMWWVWVDSNHRPHAYQACALTS